MVGITTSLMALALMTLPLQETPANKETQPGAQTKSNTALKITNVTCEPRYRFKKRVTVTVEPATLNGWLTENNDDPKKLILVLNDRVMDGIAAETTDRNSGSLTFTLNQIKENSDNAEKNGRIAAIQTERASLTIPTPKSLGFFRDILRDEQGVKFPENTK
jgi:hypothetical protein